MIVEMEAASFIDSVLKGRISPNRALGTYLLSALQDTMPFNNNIHRAHWGSPCLYHLTDCASLAPRCYTTFKPKSLVLICVLLASCVILRVGGSAGVGVGLGFWRCSSNRFATLLKYRRGELGPSW